MANAFLGAFLVWCCVVWGPGVTAAWSSMGARGQQVLCLSWALVLGRALSRMPSCARRPGQIIPQVSTVGCHTLPAPLSSVRAETDRDFLEVRTRGLGLSRVGAAHFCVYRL